LLQDTPLNAEQQQFTTSIREAAGKLHQMVEDLISLCDLETYPLSKQPLSLKSILDQVGYKLSPKAKEKGLELGWSISPEVPEVVSSDPRLLSLMLESLAENAVKFTQTGHVDIEMTRGDTFDGQLWVRIRVSDTGIGIDPDKLTFVLSGLTQGDAPLTKRYRGLGLGLATVRKVIELLNGRMGVETELGKGTTFEVSLPLKSCETSDISQCFLVDEAEPK